MAHTTSKCYLSLLGSILCSFISPPVRALLIQTPCPSQSDSQLSNLVVLFCSSWHQCENILSLFADLTLSGQMSSYRSFGILGFWSHLLILMSIGRSSGYQQNCLLKKHIGVDSSIPSSCIEQDLQPTLAFISCDHYRCHFNPPERCSLSKVNPPLILRDLTTYHQR